MYIFKTILFLYTIFKIIISQDCEYPGWTYVSGGGCRSPSTTGSVVFSTACCDTTINGVYTTGVFIGRQILDATTCPQGWSSLIGYSYQILKPSDNIELWNCKIVSGGKTVYYFLVGSCHNGQLIEPGGLVPQKQFIQFTIDNLYYIQHKCNGANGQQYVIETVNVLGVGDTITSKTMSKCIALQGGDTSATISDFTSWEYMGYRCPKGTFALGVKQMDTPNQCLPDVNECLTNNGGCSYGCINWAGPPGYSFTCTCPPGSELGVDLKSCVDTNECIVGTSGCDQTCTNTVGSHYCSCSAGYRLNANGKTCDEINECDEGTSGCAQTCTNTIGSFTCSCGSGYTLNSDSKGCTDVNECLTSNGGCAQTCTNTIGSFTCSCGNGYTLSSDGKGCNDVNECLTSNGGCAQTCVNTIGSFTCSCETGYRLNSNGKSCDDIDECSSASHQCSGVAICSNTNGGYACNCPSGYSISSNKKSCDDLDECLLNTSDCSDNTNCQNSNGSYSCPCLSGFTRVTPYVCELKPIITSFYQNPIKYFTFILQGFNFEENSIITIKNNQSKEINCEYILGNSTYIECLTKKGIEIKGNITIETNSLLSNSFEFIGAPFIANYSDKKPSTSGNDEITFFGRNLPNYGSVKLSINSKSCTIISFDGLQVENKFYYEFSQLESGECPEKCNVDSNKGKCTMFGCECNQGFTGISCNSTSGEIIPSFPPINPEIPSIEVGNGNNNGAFGYKITIIRIEELNFNDVVVDGSSIPLFNSTWNSYSNAANRWTFNITLNNKSYLESTFEYFKQSTNITFASNVFIIPEESLKLSITTKQWPFQSRLNTLRIVIQTETLIKNNDVEECSISEPVITNYNKNLWSTTENSESGMVARFISVAELDSSFTITANIKDLSDPTTNSKKSIIGISVPYFEKQSIIDPDFGMILNVDNKETGNCKGENKTNWRLATGLSVGGAGVVCLAAISTYLVKQRKIKQNFKNMINKLNQ